MKFLNFIKNLSSGTYGLIAQNYTYAYLRLKYDYSEVFSNKVDIYVAAGFVNAFAYVNANQLNDSDLYQVLYMSLGGRCGFGDYIISHGNSLNGQNPTHEKNILVNYVMQLQVLYNIIDSSYGASQVTNAILTKKPLIENNIQKIIKDFKEGGLVKSDWDPIIEIVAASFEHEV